MKMLIPIKFQIFGPKTMLNRAIKGQWFSLRTALVFTLTCLMLNVGNVGAQDLMITSIDSSAFPEVKFQIVYKGKKKFDKSELSLTQDGRPLTFTINESAPGSAPEKGRAIFLLIEASGNTFGKPLIEMREGVISAMDNLEPEDLFNAATFGSYEVDSVGLVKMADHFSASHGQIRESIISKMRAFEDTALRSDLYKNILESINYFNAEKGIPQHRILIVLSAARNNSKSPQTSSSVIGTAKEFGMPVHSITVLSSDSAYSAGRMDLISRKTKGKYFTCKSQIEIANAITDILNLPVPESMKDATYEVSLTAFNELQLNTAKIELNFRGTRQIITASTFSGGSLIPEDYRKYMWISIGILGLIVVIMVFINVFSKRKSRSSNKGIDTLAPEFVEDEVPIIEEKPQVPTIRVQQKSSYKKQETEVSSPVFPNEPPKSNGPVVLVSLNGRTQTYPLVKEETFIGRHDSNDIHVPEQTVTGRHAVIRLKLGKVSIEDLGSTNGTFVNGERIRSKEIMPSDRIRVGQIEITVKV
jgi:hypothetical protein